MSSTQTAVETNPGGGAERAAVRRGEARRGESDEGRLPARRIFPAASLCMIFIYPLHDKNTLHILCIV